MKIRSFRGFCKVFPGLFDERFAGYWLVSSSLHC